MSKGYPMQLDGLYVLEGTTFRKAKDMGEWGMFMSTEDGDPFKRHVALDYFYLNENEYCRLSTVFLGIDHNFNPDNETPILFESMIFGGEDLNETMNRYTTWEEAEYWHNHLRERIDKRLRSRSDYSTIDKSSNKIKSHYYIASIKGLVVFDEEDLRFIRED